MISINQIRTYQKHDLAQVLRAIAEWVENCANKSVTIDLKVTFNPDKEAEE